MADELDRRDFFISFTHSDIEYAQAINSTLRREGFSTYFYPIDLGLGSNIPMWMDDALMNSAHTIALYSPSYIAEKAVYSKAERYASWWQDPEGKKRKLIPIVLSGSETPLPGKAPAEHIRGLARGPGEPLDHSSDPIGLRQGQDREKTAA